MDIAALGFEIDSGPARTAATDLAKLNDAAVKASSGADKLNKTLRDSQGRFKSSYDVAKQYGSEVRRLADKYNPALSAVYKYQAAQIELNKAVALGVVTQGQANAALAKLQSGMVRNISEVEKLRLKYNPLYAASKQFEEQQEELQRALSLGAISVAQYDNALAALQAGMVRSGSAANGFSKSMGAAGQHTTNLMFQFQDIAMMLAAGQNPLMLAMQQGTQVSGVFHQMKQSGQSAFQGIIGGLSAMINPLSLMTLGVIAGGAALVQWGMDAWGAEEKARTLDDAMGDISTSISEYSGYIATASLTTAELTEKFGVFSGEMREFSVFMAGLSLKDTLATFNEQSIILREGLGGIETGLANVAMAQTQLNSISKDQDPELWLAARDALDLYQSNLDEAAKKLGILPSQAQGLADVLSGIKSDGSMSDLANSSAAALRYISSITPNAMTISGPLGDAYRAMYKVHENAKQAAKSTQELAGSAPDGDWMNPAIGGVDRLIGRVEAALGRVAALRSAAMSELASQYQQYGEGRVAGEGLVRENSKLYGNTGNVLDSFGYYDDKGGGGGGGGGGTDQYADNLTRLMESLRTERETVDAWYQENLTILNDRRAQEILGEQAHKEAMLDLEQEYLDRKSKLNSGYDQFTLGSAENLFGELYSLSGSSYDGLLKLQKTFGAAQALVNTYTAASQVLADPKLGFFAKFAAVAKTVAAGMGLVNAIKGGGSGGGGGASATSSAAPAKIEPQRVTRIELMGEDWLVNLAESMMDQVYNATGNGRVIISKASA